MPSPRQPIPSLTSSSSYELLLPIARGGMGAVYVGRLRAAAGFSRLVAIKRAHASALRDPEVRRIVVEEARVASKVHHPNIVAVQAIEELDGELLLIMDYVEGASLARLIEVSNAATPPRGLALGVALRIALDACVGLFAVHEMYDEFGRRLGLTHRDISPQNILVGVDGVARITDFGIAKSGDRPGRKTTTQVLKGKAAYMAPEYIERGTVDPRIDVFALGVTIWEVIANRRLFRARNAAETIAHVLHMNVPWLADLVPELPEPLAEAVHGALAREPSERFATARAFGDALEEATAGRVRLATHGEVAATVRALEGRTLDARRSELRVLLLGGEATADMPIPGLGPAEPAPAKAPGASAAPTGSAVTPSAESSTNPLARSAEDTAPTRADGRAASARAAASAAPPSTPVSAAEAEPAGRASSASLAELRRTQKLPDAPPPHEPARVSQAPAVPPAPPPPPAPVLAASPVPLAVAAASRPRSGPGAGTETHVRHVRRRSTYAAVVAGVVGALVAAALLAALVLRGSGSPSASATASVGAESTASGRSASRSAGAAEGPPVPAPPPPGSSVAGAPDSASGSASAASAPSASVTSARAPASGEPSAPPPAPSATPPGPKAPPSATASATGFGANPYRKGP